MAGHLRACLSNPLELCCYLLPRDGLPDGPEPAGWVDNHSQWEVLMAIAAIVLHRGWT